VSAEPATRRQSKSPDTRRQEILDAALSLFAERGFDATTVQGIAAAAGVAAGTVYLYFPSKEHVLLALHHQYHAAMQTRLEEATAAALSGSINPRGIYGIGIDAMVDAVVEFCLELPRETTVVCRYLPRIHDEVLREGEAMATYIAAAIRAGVEDGRLHVTDPEMAGRLMTAALREPLIDLMVTGRREEIPRLAAQAKEMFRKALSPRVPSE